MDYYFEGEVLGYNRVDFLVEDQVIVELKVGRFIRQEHITQVLNYLQCSHYQIGLIILFSPKGIELKRLINTKERRN